MFIILVVKHVMIKALCRNEIAEAYVKHHHKPPDSSVVALSISTFIQSM